LIEFLKTLLGDALSIFTIMNPLAVGVIMLSLLEEDATREEVRTVAKRSAKAVLLASLIIFGIGTYIFQFFGISPFGLKVFGGIILLMMAFNMVQGHGKRVNHSSKEAEAAQDRDDISIVPLAIPVSVGAGLATTLITMSAEATGWQDYLSATLAILICGLAYGLILQRMPYIKKKLGINGLRIFNRLMGLIVGSLAAQMVVTGLLALYHNFTAA
jgi:multiple antibiotic resistance protein